MPALPPAAAVRRSHLGGSEPAVRRRWGDMHARACGVVPVEWAVRVQSGPGFARSPRSLSRLPRGSFQARKTLV